jgi:hypothetical protein
LVLDIVIGRFIMDSKKHGEVIIKHQELNGKLKKYGLKIHAWGTKLAIKDIEENHKPWLVNNCDSIYEIEQWVEGFLYSKSLNDL